MSSSLSRVLHILDLPDLILVKIILHFNARERLLLADSCRRLNGLVFGDQELLRDLDFSENGYLTTAANIEQYFSKAATCQFAVKVNIQNVECLNGPMLYDSIRRAINLVDINIHGAKFEGIETLGVFLAPLLHLKRLSLDWPHVDLECNDNGGILQKSLNRLTYLSVKTDMPYRVFPPIVKLCLELEELRMFIQTWGHSSHDTWSLEGIKLKNLKVVQFCGGFPVAYKFKEDLMAIVPDPSEWTDFHLVDSRWEIYLEKNVELCNELSDVKLLSRSSSNFNNPIYNHKMGWNVVADRLLEKAITITHEDVPEKFCCLNGNGYLLKIEDAKELLKDPGYQVSHLRFHHFIGHYCDAHLLASAFPNVTELVFHGTHSSRYNIEMCQNRRMPFKRRLRKKGSTAPEEEDDSMNRESSFKILVENTPNLRSLTLTTDYTRCSDMGWMVFHAPDFNLIPSWKYLRVIILIDIPPIENANFLIDIGKECQELVEVKLTFAADFRYSIRYGSGLVQMLNHCRNLRKFSIEQPKMDNMSEVFKALSNKPKLEIVRVKTDTQKYNSLELISSIEQMLRRCPKLTRFIIRILSQDDRVNAELKPDLERIVGELNRPNLVFLGPDPGFPITENHEDVSTSFFRSQCDVPEIYCCHMLS